MSQRLLTTAPSASSRPDVAKDPEAELLAYVRLLTGEQPPTGRFLELRWRIEGGRMARRFIPATRPRDAARLIARLGARTDVYVGVALRMGGRGGGAAAIPDARLLHVDLDPSRHAQRTGLLVPGPLGSFALPTAEIASGGIGHRHLYFRLLDSVARETAQSANRRLAAHLGGDSAAVDVARLLRPPASLNHRYDPPRPVRLLAHRPELAYQLTELTSLLPPDPQPSKLPSRRAPHRTGRTQLDRQLLAIPAAEYVRVLAGLTPDSSGKVTCPFHHDTVASLQLYPDGSWYCFGACRRGGTIIDFAAQRWGLRPRGGEFLQLRDELARIFAIDAR